MKRFGRSACACSRAASSIVVVGVVGEVSGETSSETQPSTPAVRSCDRAEEVGGAAQVVERELEEAAPRPIGRRAGSAICSS